MPVRSLRARLLMPVGGVVLLALLAVAVLSSRVTRHAFLKVEQIRATRDFDLASLSERLEEHYRRKASWEGAAAVLAQLASERKGELVLTGTDGRVAAVSPGLAADRIVVLPEGGLRIEKQQAAGPRKVRRRSRAASPAARRRGRSGRRSDTD